MSIGYPDEVSHNERYTHTVLRVTMKSGEDFAVDLTHWQYGWPEVVQPWNKYFHSKVHSTDKYESFDEGTNRTDESKEKKKETHGIAKLQDNCRLAVIQRLSEILPKKDRSGRSLIHWLHADTRAMERLRVTVRQETQEVVDGFHRVYREKIEAMWRRMLTSSTGESLEQSASGDSVYDDRCTTQTHASSI